MRKSILLPIGGNARKRIEKRKTYMTMMEFVAPCHFGLESVLKQELIHLGYEISKVEDGRVTFSGNEKAICRSNVFLRTAERVLIKVGSFRAESFEDLFQGTKSIPWEDYIPKNGRFWVSKATSLKSRLYSTSDIQSIMKKAMVERLKEKYHTNWFTEDGERYPVRTFIMKDEVTVCIDTSGDSLHKRGYRLVGGTAPISETLAAALIMLTPWNKDRILVDPFCGSGTFPIEAALIGMNIAPGVNRSFLAEEWVNLLPASAWERARDEANRLARPNTEMDIQGYDLDAGVIKIARENAKRAGVDKAIHFQQRPVSALSHPKKYGFLITNPPYGERLVTEESIAEIYREFGRRFLEMDGWSCYMITSDDEAESHFGKRAWKKRKIYNGMIKTYYYQFPGPKPPKRKPEAVSLGAAKPVEAGATD